MLGIQARITRPHSARKAQPVHLCPSVWAHVSHFVLRKKRARMQFLFHVPVEILQGNRLGKVHTDSGREWISSCRTWLSDSHPRWSRVGREERITGGLDGWRPRQTAPGLAHLHLQGRVYRLRPRSAGETGEKRPRLETNTNAVKIHFTIALRDFCFIQLDNLALGALSRLFWGFTRGQDEAGVVVLAAVPLPPQSVILKCKARNRSSGKNLRSWDAEVVCLFAELGARRL